MEVEVDLESNAGKSYGVNSLREPEATTVAESHKRKSETETPSNEEATPNDVPAEEGNERWETVNRPANKRRKKKKGGQAETLTETRSEPNLLHSNASTKPILRYAELHRLQSMVKVADLQNLALYCIADDVAPQWISVQNHSAVRKVVVLLVPGLEKDMFTGEISLLPKTNSFTPLNGSQAEDNSQQGSKPEGLDGGGFQRVGRHPDEYLPFQLEESKLPAALRPLAEIFDQLWPVKTPGDDKYSRLYSPIHTMLSAPIPRKREEKQKKKNKQQSGAGNVTPSKQGSTQRTPITAYLASNDELYESDYVLHPASLPSSEREALSKRREHNEQDEGHGWRDASVKELSDGDVSESEIEQGSITVGRTIYTIDCEMCMVDEEFALTRISMVDWDGEVVLDELVKPDRPITNYLTPYSGMTEEKLADVTTTLKDIQSRLLQLLHPKTILAGHSLESDLRALKMTHPFIVDTSFLYPHPRGPPLRSSLKWLSQKYLGKEIQKGHGSSGHDSVEDARATLALIKQKCEKGPEWGTQGGAQQESIFKRISRSRGRLEAGDERGFARTAGAIVDHATPERTFNGMATYYLGATDDAGVVASVQRAVKGDSDGAYIPGGGVDLTWARLRDLEALRGWATEKEGVEPPEPDTATLSMAVSKTVSCIKEVHKMLPPCTMLIVYSGTGDPRPLRRLQETQRQFRREYAVKKWDELSVQWTDTEEQALRKACGEARRGIGFLAIT